MEELGRIFPPGMQVCHAVLAVLITHPQTDCLSFSMVILFVPSLSLGKNYLIL